MNKRIKFSRWLCVGVACGLTLLSAATMAQGGHRGRMADRVRDARTDRVERKTERQTAPERSQSLAGDASDASKERGRMSPEERRQLRSDVRQAGRELYPDRPPRRE